MSLVTKKKSGPHPPVRTPQAAPAVRASARELARRLGVSDRAIRKAIRGGKFKESIGYEVDGSAFVKDLTLAVVEWKTFSSRGADQGADRGPGADRSAPRSAPPHKSAPEAPAAAAVDESEGDELEDEDGGNAGMALDDVKSLIDAQKVATYERARKLQMENDVRAGQLVPVAKVAKEAFEAERTIREALLNLPARIAAELAGESDPGKVYLLLDAALRGALTAAADALEQSAASLDEEDAQDGAAAAGPAPDA